jgi:hypothetical protein
MQRDFALAQSCSQVQYGSAFQASSPKTKAGFAGLFLSAYQGSNLSARYRSGNTRSARLYCIYGNPSRSAEFRNACFEHQTPPPYCSRVREVIGKSG